jgi:hypothetical protein
MPCRMAPMSETDLILARLRVREILDDAKRAENKLNAALAELGRPTERVFLSDDEHAKEIAALKPAPPPPGKLRWTRGGASLGEAAPAPDASVALDCIIAALADARFSESGTFRELTRILALSFRPHYGPPPSARRHAVKTILDSFSTLAPELAASAPHASAAAPAPVVEGKVRLTAELVDRACAIRDGKLVELPTDSLARAAILAGRRRRGEDPGETK